MQILTLDVLHLQCLHGSRALLAASEYLSTTTSVFLHLGWWAA